MNQIARKRKSTDLYVRQIPGSEVHFCTVFPCQICMGLHEICSSVLLTKREVKMAGYWPSSFFFFAFLWTETGYDGFISSQTEILGEHIFYS